MYSMMFRVYGQDGHRQRVSFRPSYVLRFDYSSCFTLIEVLCSDITGSNDFVDLIITSSSESDCISILRAQLSDGIFENSRFGDVYRVSVTGIASSTFGLADFDDNFYLYDSSCNGIQLVPFNWDSSAVSGGIYR